MGYMYIDDSVHDAAGFVLAACVYSHENLQDAIDNIIVSHDLDPNTYEFKSATFNSRNPKNSKVRSDLQSLINSKCNLGIVVVPRDKRELLGIECIKALKIFLEKNIRLKFPMNIYFDEGFFPSQEHAQKLIDHLGFNNCSFHIEQNSKNIKGIQIADVAAHSASIQLKETLGLISKVVKAGPNSGYDPDLYINLGFELWASIRYAFFNQGSKLLTDDPIEDATLEVEPYGLFISEYCSPYLAAKARDTFAKVYLGCIH